MKHHLLTFLLFFYFAFGFSQPNTEIFLFDLLVTNDSIQIANGKNISNNEGYDNQPSFLNDSEVLFASTRNHQTDIATYNINYDSKIWRIDTPESSEYSPTKIPNKNEVSTIRLDNDGKQLLYSYSLASGNSSILIEDLVVGYHTWFDENIIVSSVLDDGNLSLYVTNLKKNKNKKLQEKVGRSLHKIPNSSLISYVSKENDSIWEIRSLNPITKTTKFIAKTLYGSEDMCWTTNGSILMGKNNEVYKFNPKTDKDWVKIGTLEHLGLTDISRLTTNPNSTKLAIAAIQSPGFIVQKHIAPYNTGDLDGFTNAFAENVLVTRFPSDTMYVGRETMKRNYEQFFEKNTNLSVKVNNRIVINNMVIDEEVATVNDKIHRQATIYKIENGTIKSMTFINDQKVSESPENIVQKQLDAYNARDINGFMATYTNTIELYNFPDELRNKGQETMRQSFTAYFEKTTDLHCEIKNRIVVGNKVIIKEYITANGQNFSAVAIYEVENGLIKKVTFVR